MDLAVGRGKLNGGSGSVWGEGVKRAGPQRERGGGDSLLATADSIRQQHRTAFFLLVETYAQQLQASHLLCGQRVVVRCFFESVRGGGLGPCG